MDIDDSIYTLEYMSTWPTCQIPPKTDIYILTEWLDLNVSKTYIWDKSCPIIHFESIEDLAQFKLTWY